MNKQTIDESLVDEVIDAYVTWREQRAAVWDAYDRWAHVLDERMFGAYRDALDREEDAAGEYATALARIVSVAGSQLGAVIDQSDLVA